MSSPAPPIAPAVGGEEDVRAALAEMRRQNEQLRAQAAVDAAQIKALRSVLEDRVQTSPSVKPAADVERLVTARVPTEFGVFDVVLFSGGPDGKLDRDGEVALVYGGFEKIQRDGAKDAPGVLVRVHSSCFTGDVLSSNRCDCGEQLHTSMQMIAKNGSGVLLYLHQEGRGIGLLAKLKAYNLQDQGLDTVDANLALGHPADARDYTVAAKMLGEMGVHSVRLITNNPAKVGDLTERGLDVTERVSIIPERVTRANFRYLQTKAARMDHALGARFDGVLCPAASTADDLSSSSSSSSAAALALSSSASSVSTTTKQRLAEIPQDRPAVLYANKPPYPVVDVNELWLQTCGFTREEVVGQTMSIIQGPLTEGREVSRLMDTIFLATSAPLRADEQGDDPSSKYVPPSAKLWMEGGTEDGVTKKPARATLINYTKDRTPFVNEVEILPFGPPDGTCSEHLLAVSTMRALDEQRAPLTEAESTPEAETAAAVEEAVRRIAEGGMVLVADDEGRENEGDLIVASQFVTEQQVAFMVQHCTGIVCAAMDEAICDRLKLPLMVQNNEEYMGTKFCVTVDGGPQSGVTTGVSAWDRATTIRALADPATQPTDLVRPGHIFPLRYTAGGVLVRGGHTEASVDLCKLAGLVPAGTICELVKPHDEAGGMARREDMVSFAKQHNLPCCSIGQMQRYIQLHGLGKIAALREGGE